VGKSILLVDGDPEVLTFLTLLFEEKGVRVLRARTASEALEVLQRDYVPVDLVLTNIMINSPGSEFARDATRTRPGVAVLLMSAFVDEEVIRVEVMKRSDFAGNSMPDDQGVVKAVMSALSKTRVSASAI